MNYPAKPSPNQTSARLVAGSTPNQRSSPIFGEMVQVADALDFLDKNLAALYDKIHPALGNEPVPDSPLSVAGAVEPSSGCELTDKLSGFKYRIRRLAQEVAQVTERCHL